MSIPKKPLFAFAIIALICCSGVMALSVQPQTSPNNSIHVACVGDSITFSFGYPESLQTKLGNDYFLRIIPYPHSILRENKMIFGAHADRLQDGMRHAFGKPIGTAARVRTNQPIIIVAVNEDSVEIAKQALRRGRSKLPLPCRVAIERKGD